MIDGFLLFLLILIVYSFWWFDFYFLKKNTLRFKKDFKKALEKSDVVLLFHAGGWGTIDYKNAFDLNPFSRFIEKYLEQKGFRVSIVQYFRTEDHLIGKIGYLKDYAFNFPKQSEIIASVILETDKKVILLGLSNGALIVDEVMEKVKEKNNIFSIEIGKPFFGMESENKNIFLINEPEDDLSNGNTLELLKATFILGPIKWIKNFILGEGFSVGKAVQIKGHNYPFEKYQKKVVYFINKKILCK